VELSVTSSFHFLHPLWLLALPPLLALAGWFARSGRADASWSKIVDPELLALMRLPGPTRRSSPWALVATLWVAAVVALASPTWQRRTVNAYHAPAAWVIVLDLSPTMTATDVTPDRVTRARYSILDLLSAARDARVGLVVFAGEPHVVAPLTSDVATVRTLLQPLAPKLMPETGDNLAPALDEAARLLNAAHFRSGHIAVLTDGFSDPSSALAAAKRLRETGSTVDVVGVGTTEGAPMPGQNGEFVRDAQGGLQMTRLRPDQLQRVASAGGGSYFSLSDVAHLTRQLRDDSHSAAQSASTVHSLNLTMWLNQGFWLLPPMLLIGALVARRGWI
jgi:Ca-activated chloride channel family protein